MGHRAGNHPLLRTRAAQRAKGVTGRCTPAATASWGRCAELLRRIFAFDILACPDCGARLRLMATIEQPGVIEKILMHLGLPAELPRPAPARSPAWLPSFSE